MTSRFIRVGQERDVDEVMKHLIVVGELTGDCFSCRQIGIDYTREKYCPGCRTDFRFMAYRSPLGMTPSSQVARLCQRRPDLTYIEFADIKEIADRKKAKDIFK